MKYSLGDKRVKLVGGGQFIAPNAAVIGERLTEYAVTGSPRPIPGLLAAALRA